MTKSVASGQAGPGNRPTLASAAAGIPIPAAEAGRRLGRGAPQMRGGLSTDRREGAPDSPTTSSRDCCWAGALARRAGAGAAKEEDAARRFLA